MHNTNDPVFPDTEHVWESFSDRLLAFIRKRVNDHAESEDVLQDVFIKIHRNIGSLSGAAKLESWVYQIARNAIVDFYRARRDHIALPPSLEAGMGENVGREELSNCLAALVQRLPEKYRRPVRLYEMEGLSQKEIAEAENLSLSGAKSRIQRGRAMMQQLLHDCCQCRIQDREEFMDCLADGGKCDGC